MYLDQQKQVVFKNPKEILAVLQSQKSAKRQLPKGLDAGEESVLKHYSDTLLHWLDIQAGKEIENTMDDIFAGDITFTKTSSEKGEEEQAFLDEKYQAENFDLICWVAVQN
jgi:hypothetical protein